MQGYASIVLADGLDKALNVEIAHVVSGGSPHNAVSSLKQLYQNFKLGLIDQCTYVAVLMGAVYSSSILI